MALSTQLREKLQEIQERYQALEKELADPAVLSDGALYKKRAKEHADLSDVVEAFRSYQKADGQVEESLQLLDDSDPELAEMAQAELEEGRERLEEIEGELHVLLLPKDPNDEKNVILEVRAGTGGEEAALFAADLFRMYLRFAERQGWQSEILSSHETGAGGFKEVVALITGHGAYSKLKYESGVHRVQRVPVTESQGRVHTSAVTVAVLPEAEEVEVDIKTR